MSVCSSPDLPESILRGGNNLLNHSTLLCDRYRILKPLGQTGGKTFLAIDQWQTPLYCVVKQLPLDDSIHHQKVLTFDQTAQRLAKLGEHPQIPTLLDAFEQDGKCFIVQEWIDGCTLKQEGVSTAFDQAEVCQVLQELLPVLQYLHDRQVIHGDIKPANIIRRRFPVSNHQENNHQENKTANLVLVDFGAVKQLINGIAIDSNTMIGSVEYAAPEQIRGQAVFASDLYSIGATCLYLLAQTSPFDLYDIVENGWKWQAYLPQPIHSDLKAILCKLLQPVVRRRYQSATEVLNDLNALSLSVDHGLSQKNNCSSQNEDAIANPLTTKSPSSKTHSSPGLNLTVNVQTTRFMSKATICPAQAQGCSNTKCDVSLDGIAALDQSKAAFFFNSRSATAILTSLAQTPLFAEDIASLRALPLAWRVLIVGTGAAASIAAMTCLVVCLGIIFFALSTPLHADVSPLKDSQTILK